MGLNWGQMEIAALDVEADGDSQLPFARNHGAIRRKPVSNSSIPLVMFRQISPTSERENLLPSPASTPNPPSRIKAATNVPIAPLDYDTTNSVQGGYNEFKDPLIYPSRKAPKSARPAWFVNVSAGLLFAVLVLAANIGLLIWARTRFDVINNVAIVFHGSCSKASSITGYAELAINILSTVLLAASNNCCQILVSPIRSEMDDAHRNGTWVHIGVASFRNFNWIGRWRVLLWCLLFSSSIPLHLLYNSVVFSSSYTSDFMTAVVTEAFTDGGWWKQALDGTLVAANSSAGASFQSGFRVTQLNYTNILLDLQNGSKNLTELSNEECQAIFGGTNLQRSYLNVLVITNYTQNDSFISGAIHYPEWGANGAPWFNASDQPGGLMAAGSYDGQWYYSHGSNWSFLAGIWNCGDDPCLQASSVNSTSAWAQNCLAQSETEFMTECTISISTGLLLAVISCNCIKIFVLSATLFTSFHPLVTVGDAVGSFMNRADPTTVGCGPLSLSMVNKLPQGNATLDAKAKQFLRAAHVWKAKARNWVKALNSYFVVWSLVLCAVAWAAVLITLAIKWAGPFSVSWSHGEVTLSTYSTLASTSSNSLVANAVRINTPQLVVSFVYVLYNSALTRMFIANEFSKFGWERRTLRVSRPTGRQRSTYWLQLPYRWILPIMATMALLHWLISRGFYLVTIRVYNVDGVEDTHRARFSYATSGMGYTLAFIVGTVLLAVLFVLMYRKLDSRMPLIGTCSLAISAACHAAEGDHDAATKPLMYGVVRVDQIEDGQTWHACFSSKDVDPLQDGVEYC